MSWWPAPTGATTSAGGGDGSASRSRAGGAAFLTRLAAGGRGPCLPPPVICPCRLPSSVVCPLPSNTARCETNQKQAARRPPAPARHVPQPLRCTAAGDCAFACPGTLNPSSAARITASGGDDVRAQRSARGEIDRARRASRCHARISPWAGRTADTGVLQPDEQNPHPCGDPCPARLTPRAEAAPIPDRRRAPP